jgi:PKD repeat protein
MMKPIDRFLARVTCLLVVLTTGLLLSLAPATARDVPFPTEHTVDGAFDGATSVYAADLDGDGDLDILGSAADDNAITWWENQGGTGAFTVAHPITTSFAGAAAVTAADLDGDGDLDVLGAASTDNAITWWENQGGTDTFTVIHPITTSFAGATAVAVADLDRDGDLDVLGAANVDDDVTWWENTDGSGTTWTVHTVDTAFDGAASVYAADVDGDGDLDVLGAASEDDDVTWWENTDGSGTTWTERAVDTAFDGAASVYAADVDGDGDLDALSAASVDADVAWWENTNGSGTTWTERAVDTAFGGAASVYAADMDGDGDVDVLGAASVDDDVTWWENTDGSGTTWTERAVDTAFGGAALACAADVDGDGDLDVLGAASVDDDVTWWENTTIHRSAVYLVEHAVDAQFVNAHCVYAADVDGDGDMDVLGAAYDSSEDFTWWENTSGDGTAWDEHLIYEEFAWAWEIRATDIDGDGDLDVLGTAYDTDDVIWWENTGPCTGTGGACTNWIEHGVDTEADGAQGVYAADVDGDGDLDVVAALMVANDIVWWENTAGDGTAWTEHIVDGFFGGAWAVHAADVDGDGDVDVLGAAWGGAGTITWWENVNGGGTSWAEHTVDGLFAQAQSVYTADVDGDGDTDVLGAAYADDDITWWENTGACTGTGGACTSWIEHTVDGDFDGAYTVYAADVDVDGDMDILGAARSAGDITWWENDGAGGGWTEHPVDEAFTGAQAVYAADVDGDGDVDVLGAARGVNDIAWWENQGGQFALATTSTAPAAIDVGRMDDVLRIVMTHRGRTGDTDEEFATLELLFEESAGDPLTIAEANAIIENLYVYLDNGSGAFESGADTLVTTVGELTLTGGRQTVAFTDGDTNVRVVYGTPRTYFVVTELTGNASQQTPSQFRITHITEESSTAEDRDHDVVLSLEYAANTSSGIIAATNDPPAADAGAGEPYSGAEGSPITFDSSDSFDPEGMPLTYQWDWEDDGTYDVTTMSATAIHVWADDGVYTVTLRVIDSGNLMDTDTVTVAVANAAPTADAGGPYTGDEGSSIDFDASGSSDPGNDALTYAWDLDNDGEYDDAVGVTASYTWMVDGPHVIGLIVTDNGGLTDTDTAQVTVRNLAPTADAGGPYTGDEGSAIHLDASGSSDPGNDALTYAWDLDNDGRFDDAPGATPSYIWAEPGIFTIRLVVTDTGGLTDVATAQVTVSNLAPSADAGGPYVGDEGSAITFDASGSLDPGGGALTYAWDLDDDGGYDDAIGVTASYTWTEQVTLTIGLIITDTRGLTDTAAAQVVVRDLDPIADFIATPWAGEEPLMVTFTDISVSYDGIITRSWDLNGDGSPDATIPNPAFEYTVTGTYTVTLTVWEGDGDSDTKAKVGYIHVGPIRVYLPMVRRGG